MFVLEEIESGLSLFLNYALSSLGIIALIILWKAIYKSNDFFGITENEMISYYLGVLIIGKIMKSGADDYFKEKVESGDISNDFVKPVNYVMVLFTRTIAKILIYFLGMTVIAFMLSLTLKLPLSMDYLHIIFGIPIILFAFLLGFSITTIIGSLYFYFPNLRYFAFLARDIIIGLLAGVMFNLELLTGNIYKIFNILPFKYIINFPVLVLTGDISLKQILSGFLTQIIWTILSLIFCILFFKQGYKKYSSYGG